MPHRFKTEHAAQADHRQHRAAQVGKTFERRGTERHPHHPRHADDFLHFGERHREHFVLHVEDDELPGGIRGVAVTAEGAAVAGGLPRHDADIGHGTCLPLGLDEPARPLRRRPRIAAATRAWSAPSSSWRAEARHPRLALVHDAQSWMPTFVGMTGERVRVQPIDAFIAGRRLTRRPATRRPARRSPRSRQPVPRFPWLAPWRHRSPRTRRAPPPARRRQPAPRRSAPPW